MSRREGLRHGRVVVVGAGLAGLTAALTLTDLGVPVTLLERRPRLGGATASFRRDGLSVDTGQHVFLRCCVEYLGLLRRLDVADRVALQARLDVPVLAPGGVRARLRRTALPAPLHLGAALAGYRHLSPADRLRAVRGALAMRRLDPDDDALDTRTLGAFLAEHGQSEQVVAALWDVIATATLNLPAADASLQLAARVFRTGVLDSASGGDMGWSLVPLGELHGEAGDKALTAAGAEVRTGVAVRAVVPGSDPGPDGAGWLVYTDAGTLPAAAVVLAVPAGEVGPLLPPRALPVPERLGALGTSPIVNVHVVYDRPVLPVPFAAAVRSPVQWVFDRTGPSGLAEGQYLAVSLSAAEAWVDQPTQQIRDTFEPALKALLPRARATTVRELFVTRERRATFRQGVGSNGLRPGAVTAMPGLLLAGAWTDTGWPDTMEGAVRSGRTAADAALDYLGRSAHTRNAPPQDPSAQGDV
jgi:squalene-associated FAD-dependent desaturase